MDGQIEQFIAKNKVTMVRLENNYELRHYEQNYIV